MSSTVLPPAPEPGSEPARRGSYIPEICYGLILGGRNGFGLTSWPALLQPCAERPEVELTKKGEAYVAAALAEADGVFFLTLDPRHRSSIATTIERLIAMLDAMEPDPDLEETGDDEPNLGWPNAGQWITEEMASDDDREEDIADHEATLGWANSGSQAYLHSADASTDDREEENEHGGDIQDEPHDEVDQGDAEPFLGWSEHQSLHGCIATGDEFSWGGNGPTSFNGDGYLAGNVVLQTLRRKRPDRSQSYISPIAGVGGDASALHVDGLKIVGKARRRK